MKLKRVFHPLLVRLVPRLAWCYIWGVVLTSRIQATGKNHLENLVNQKKGFIIAVWHSRHLFLTWAGRDIPLIHVLISQSADGDFISRFCDLFSLNPVRGSTSRGGAKALVSMIRLIRNHKIVVITPDGPRGPAEEVQSGSYFVAAKTGCPILPLSVDASRKKVFSSWDRFLMPLPFSRIHIVYGEPLTIHPDAPQEVETQRIKESLMSVGRQAREFL